VIISAESDSAYFIGQENFGRYDVWLDGVLQRMVINANDGVFAFVTRAQHDRDGRIMVADNGVVRECLFGRLAIIDKHLLPVHVP
jgi:hypothetical protein